MKIENRIVCFLDILGFREIIDEFEKSRDDKIIKKIKTAFKSSMDLINKFSDPEFTKDLEFEPEKVDSLVNDLYYKTFSDNVIITIRYDEVNDSFYRRLSLLLVFSNMFQFEMLSSGVYSRGGVSFGSFYKDEHIIFSTALVKAYELENKNANFPRIILDKKLIELMRDLDPKNIKNYGFFNLVYLDIDNIAFLSPFGPMDSTLLELGAIFSDEEIISPGSPLYELFNVLPENVKTAFQKPHLFQLEQYKIILKDIKSKSNNNSYSENVRNKYLWLIEFYNWKYNNINSNFHFTELTTYIS